MKKTILIILLFLLTGFATFGVFISEFRGRDDLIEISPDIIVAKCTSTYGMKPSDKRLLISDGVIPSDVEVLSVLKGNTKPGPAQLQSQYWPYAGQQFAVFGWYSDGAYSAVESYRIVPLSRYFSLGTLSGKTLGEQMQIILSNRLSNLDEEIDQDKTEKSRIHDYLKKK